MRVETVLALIIGVLLPLLETCRRGLGHWAVEFTTMFEDYLGGALLLIAGWASYRRPRWGILLLVVAWGRKRLNEHKFLVPIRGHTSR